MAKKEFPNNWQRIHDAPDEQFADDITWKDFVDCRIDLWDLMDNVALLCRQELRDPKGKIYRIVERSYQKHNAAEKWVLKAIKEDPTSKFIFVDDVAMGEAEAIEIQQNYFD